jgi:hypothetical protein
MSTKIMSNDDSVIHDNTVFGFSLNTLIGNNTDMNGLKDLSVPAGLFLINKSSTISGYADFTQKGDVISDALYESLISSAEPKLSSKKKQTKRARRSTAKKTRRK